MIRKKSRIHIEPSKKIREFESYARGIVIRQNAKEAHEKAHREAIIRDINSDD